MKKFIHKIIAIAFVLIALITGLVPGATAQAQGDDNSVEAIQERGVLRVAIFGDLPPYGYTDEQGNYVGFSVVLAERLAEELLGDPGALELIAVNGEERVETLQSGRADIVLANFTYTDERAAVVDFADPYMKVAIGIASRKDNPVTDVAQLEGETLILAKGTTAEALFTSEYPEVNLDRYETKNQEFQALLDGRGIALADDNSYLFPWVKENPDYVVGITEFGEVSTINPAVKKGNESLLNFLNETIAKLGAEGFFVQLYNEELAPHFGEDVQAGDILLEEHVVEAESSVEEDAKVEESETESNE